MGINNTEYAKSPNADYIYELSTIDLNNDDLFNKTSFSTFVVDNTSGNFIYTVDYSNEHYLTHLELLQKLKDQPNTEKLLLRNCTRIAVTILFDLVNICPKIKEVDMSLDKPENCLMIQPATFLSEEFSSREFSLNNDTYHLSLKKFNCTNHLEMSNRTSRNMFKLLSSRLSKTSI